MRSLFDTRKKPQNLNPIRRTILLFALIASPLWVTSGALADSGNMDSMRQTYIPRVVNTKTGEYSDSASTQGAKQGGAVITHGPLVSPTEFRGDLRNLSLQPSAPGERVFPAPLEAGLPSTKFTTPPASEAPAGEQPSVQGPGMPTPNVSFKGLDHNTWGAGWPPDPVGDVGPNHYVQAVNTSIGIFNKSGTRLAAFTLNSFWSGADTGTACDNQHGGDPTVVYDPLANRWFVADFAFANFNSPPYYECIAVSKSGDPVNGGWWFYAIRTDDAQHPWFADYPKMGIWPDGLYMTANMYQMPAGTFRGVRVWAFNRTDMEAGIPVRNVIVDLGNTAYFSLLPSNFRGDPPPAGRENFLVSEALFSFDFEVFKFHVDYSGSGSTFTMTPTLVDQASYTLAADTVPSPVNALDSLRERLMMQAQYRRVGNAESLWVNHTVRTPGGGPTGIQWAQINVTGGTIVTTPVQQQIYGNLSGDGIHRWMGSLAVDKDGNMALGYSASSSSLNPDIRYNGRLASDPLNTLPQGEATMLTGVTRGTQSGNCGGDTCIRWGDYSAMTVDPDGCTFWYTNEYYESTGLNWQTRIGSFKFPTCSTGSPAISLIKGASPTTYDHVGQMITYSYTIQNTGDVTLAGPFSIIDDQLGTISPCGNGPLTPGATTGCTATHFITQADLDAGSISNSAIASTTFGQNTVTSQSAGSTVIYTPHRIVLPIVFSG